MATMFGLISTEAFSNERFKSWRRTVLYFYPQGAAPLTGLLSLMDDESCNDPQFYCPYEKRMAEQRLASAAISSTIPWYTIGINVSAGKITAATIANANFTTVVGTQYAIKCAATPENTFRIGHIVKIVVTTTTTTTDLLGQINAINTSSDTPASTIGFTALNAVTLIDYDSSANVGIDINVVGSAFAEGAVGSSDNITTVPIAPYNYTQIHRTSYKITGTALKTSAKFDDRGVYPDEAKEAALNHSIEMEKAFLWGARSMVTSTSNGEVTVTRTSAGLMSFLRDWEAGTTYGNTAATTDSDDNKRIIVNATGRLARKTFSSYLERAFRVTNNKTSEKLVLCGSGALNVFNQMFMSTMMQMVDAPATDTYGMDIMKCRCPYGSLFFKTHPLFSQNPIWRNSALIIDVPNLAYRYLEGRDTELLKDRAPNDADYIKHEYLTECGLEVNFPESHMYIQNILDWEP